MRDTWKIGSCGSIISEKLLGMGCLNKKKVIRLVLGHH
jgi:hypothetical protein